MYDFDNQSIVDMNINVAMSKYEMARSDLFNLVYSLGRKLNEADVSVVSLDANAKQYMQDVCLSLDKQVEDWRKVYYAQWIEDFTGVIKDVNKILHIYVKYFNECDLQEAAVAHDICKRLVSINMLSDKKFDRNAKLDLMICFRRLSHILNLDIV
ncbi:hypothetical protein [Campylobacter concisus]